MSYDVGITSLVLTAAILDFCIAPKHQKTMQIDTKVNKTNKNLFSLKGKKKIEEF